MQLARTIYKRKKRAPPTPLPSVTICTNSQLNFTTFYSGFKLSTSDFFFKKKTRAFYKKKTYTFQLQNTLHFFFHLEVDGSCALRPCLVVVGGVSNLVLLGPGEARRRGRQRRRHRRNPFLLVGGVVAVVETRVWCPLAPRGGWILHDLDEAKPKGEEGGREQEGGSWDDSDHVTTKRATPHLPFWTVGKSSCQRVRTR